MTNANELNLYVYNHELDVFAVTDVESYNEAQDSEDASCTYIAATTKSVALGLLADYEGGKIQPDNVWMDGQAVAALSGKDHETGKYL